MNRRRVLLLMKALGRGGAEQIILHSASHTNRECFDYEVAYLLPLRNELVGPLTTLGYRVHCLHGARGVSWILRLRRLVQERDIDIIHCHTPFVAAGARIAFGRSRPIVVATEHNSWRRYHRATYWANLLTYPRTDHVFAVSRAVRDTIKYPRMLRFLPMPPVEVLIHGVQLDSVRQSARPEGVRPELGAMESDFLIGSVANMKSQKGLEYLLEAVALLRARGVEVRLILVGEGPLQSELKALCSSLQIQDSVIFTGYRPDAVRIASAFDVFILPSTFEGLPIALIEAMAIGKPCIVTEVGGMPEAVEDGRQGLIVPPRDPGALSDAILRLQQSPSLRARMGAAAKSRAAAFDIRRSVERSEDVYKLLLRLRADT